MNMGPDMESVVAEHEALVLDSLLEKVYRNGGYDLMGIRNLSGRSGGG